MPPLFSLREPHLDRYVGCGYDKMGYPQIDIKGMNLLQRENLDIKEIFKKHLRVE